MPTLNRIGSIEEFRRMARRRLPRVLFDYLDGGAGDESGMRRNREAFQRVSLVPRYLVDVATRSLATRLMGRDYGAPVGVAPVGLAGLLRKNAEIMLAQAAREYRVPFVLSGVSIASIEDAARAGGDCTWYQIYPAPDPAINLDMLHRARDAGVEVLVLTVDLPIVARRVRDIRNGFRVDMPLSLSLLADALCHPIWTMEYVLRGGLPAFGTWVPYVGSGARASAVARFVDAHSYTPQTWRDVETYRRAWPGRLVLKGVQHAEDARRAENAGVDGLIVSNHGGRQLECLPSALDVLPVVRAAVGQRLTVMMDGGIRSGADIAIALALGADFVFVGRAAVYGVVAAGLAGAKHALGLLTGDLSLTMGQLGVTDISGLSADLLPRSRDGSGAVAN